MRPVWWCLTLTVCLAFSGNSAAQAPQNQRSRTRTLTGVVTTVTDSLVTIARVQDEITVAVDSSTRLVARGQSRDLLLRTPDPLRNIKNVLKRGDHVEVRCRQEGSSVKAVEIRRLDR